MTLCLFRTILVPTVALILNAQADRDLNVVSTEPRSIALVVGNGNYPTAPVRTAVSDARLIGRALRQSGFQVTEQLDVRFPELERSIDQFVRTIRRGDIVAVYYGGLCLGIGQENYLVPVDFSPKDAADAKYAAYSVTRLLDRIEGASAATIVLFLDASHKNPFSLADPVKETPVAVSGGATTHIVLAAPTGKTSFEVPDSKNGLFAGFLADSLATPNLTLSGLFGQLQEKVYTASSGLQAPVVTTGADTRVVLTRSSTSATGDGIRKYSFESEFNAWQTAQKGPADAAIRDFLAAYPDGSFSEGASNRLQISFSGAKVVDAGPAAAGLVSANTITPSTTIEKMARITKPELDPNFDFVEADLEMLVQTDAMNKRLERDAVIVQDPALNDYVTQVGQSILPSLAPPSRVRWQFRVARDPSPNAFALPNGSIYINSGLLAILENESQLAGILAHELTHVTGRHTFYANRDYRKKSLGISLVQMGANYAPVGGLVADAVHLSLQVTALIMPVIFQATINGYSRELERQADLYAVEKLLDTGYDPRELANAFKKLQEKTEVQLYKVYYTDHPKLEDRISYVQTALANKGVSTSVLYATQAKRYAEATRKVRLDNITWTIQSGNRRTANVLARRMVEAEPESPDTLAALADTYRALGPWTADIKPQELTEQAKKDAQKAKAKLTPQEEEARVLQSAEGQAAWRENAQKAEELYQKALTLQPGRCEIHRSLGALYEKSAETSKARAEYATFLESCPDHAEAVRVQRKIASLDGLQPRKNGHNEEARKR